VGDPELSLSLPSTSEAPKLARLAISRLPGIDAVRDDVTLVVSELVANAVVHSGARADDSIGLQVSRAPGQLTVCVRDAGRSSGAPHLRPAGETGSGGYGLMLVSRLAGEWDTRSSAEEGCVVWARIAVPESAPAHSDTP
jgi:anti-sigma regulatory factor (Ser/Thr protein kinase)